jgi:hypothetical protein
MERGDRKGISVALRKVYAAFSLAQLLDNRNTEFDKG